jgi:hypothetical protein
MKHSHQANSLKAVTMKTARPLTSLIFTSLCALALSACSSGTAGTVYDMPVSHVYETIARTNVPDSLRKSMRGTPGTDIVVSRVTNQSVTWKLTEYGHELARFVARVEPEGSDGTRVTVDFVGKEDGKFKQAGMRLNDSSLLTRMVRATMEEQIAAKLEGRGYDDRQVAAKMAAYAIANIDSLEKEVEEFSEAGSAAEDEFRRERISGEPAEARISNNRPMVSTKPMVSTRPAVSNQPMVDNQRY